MNLDFSQNFQKKNLDLSQFSKNLDLSEIFRKISI